MVRAPVGARVPTAMAMVERRSSVQARREEELQDLT